jgi:hypothetical protein
MAEPYRPTRARHLPRGLVAGTALAVLGGTISSAFLDVRGATRASDDPNVVAIHGGRVIPLEQVALHHCHDGEFPTIRCFDTEEERDEHVSLPSDSTSSVRAKVGPNDGPATGRTAESLAILFYVTFYQNASYGGASFTASQPYPDLRVVNWNDLISSFKSLNGQRPKWWEHISYAPPAWQWAAGAQVSYVGDGANDSFSSTKNVP